MAFLDPGLDPQGAVFHCCIFNRGRSSGFTGVGLMESKQSFFIFRSAYRFIYAVDLRGTGIIGALAVIALFGFTDGVACRCVCRSDGFGRCWRWELRHGAVQALINFAVVLAWCRPKEFVAICQLRRIESAGDAPGYRSAAEHFTASREPAW